MGIIIVDKIMGSGKTTTEINRIKARTSQERLNTPLLIVVPLKDEIARYIRECEGENLVEPTSYYSTYDSKYFNKSESLLGLLTRGQSIVTTHALFSLFTPEIEAEIERQGYEVIMDEEVATFEPLPMKKDVWKEINKLEYIMVDNFTGRVIWVGPEDETYEGKFKEVRAKMLKGNVYICEPGKLFIIQTPISFFRLTKNYIILTYMFECSDMCAYFKLHNIPYTMEKQDKEEERIVKERIKSLIEFLPLPRSIQAEADKRITHFSYNYWVSRSPKKLSSIRTTIGNCLMRMDIKSKDMLYACPKIVSSTEEDKTKKGKHVQIRGYKDHTVIVEEDGIMVKNKYINWIPYNSKATNKYAKKNVIIYMQNVYENINIQKYLKSVDVEKTEEQQDAYSLSVMLQCIWRTAIRNNKPIKVMILSNRMRELFDDWMAK